MNQRYDSDDELLDLLAGVLMDEPSPQAMRVALGAAQLVGIRDELAQRDYDSLLDDEAVLLRSDMANQRAASYTLGAKTLEFENLDDGETLLGQVMPPLASKVQVVQFGATNETTSDDRGRFRCRIAPGPVQLRVHDGKRGVATAWLTR